MKKNKKKPAYQVIYRSAKTGRFVSEKTASKRPNTTVKERGKKFAR